MAAASERPTLAQLRQQQQRERRGRAPRAGRGAGHRRGREEQPTEESDPAAKRLRVDESSAPPSPPRSVEEVPGIPGHGVPANVAGTSTAHTPEGQLQPRGSGRTVINAYPEAGGGSDVGAAEEWSPIYVGRGGVKLTTADSVRANPDVANVLLKGLALPADMSAVDALSLDDNFVELHSCLVKASQASTAVHKKAVALANASRAAKAKLKEERKAAEQMKAEIDGLGKKLSDLSLEKQGVEGKIKSAEDRADAAEADARRAEERAKSAEDKFKEANERAKALEAQLRDLQTEQQEMLTAADENGFRRGEREAGRQYLKESEEIEVAAFRKGYCLGHADCFPSAYIRGVDACSAPPDAEARVIPPVPEPQIPEMPFDDPEDDAEEGGDDDQGHPAEDTQSEAPAV